MDQQDQHSLDTYFRADMIQGRFKQQSLRHCGFTNALEQQVGAVCCCTAGGFINSSSKCKSAGHCAFSPTTAS